MRVLLADKLSDSVVSNLQGAGCEVKMIPELKGESLTAELAAFQPEVLVVRSTKVLAADFSVATGLELVVRAGAGYDNVDVVLPLREESSLLTAPVKTALQLPNWLLVSFWL